MSKAFLRGVGGTGGGGTSEFEGLIDGTITSFVLPAGKTVIRPYLCNGITSLSLIDITGAEEVKEYAFQNCSNALVTLSKRLRIIGNYAFNGIKYGQTLDLELDDDVICSVGTQGVQGQNQNSLYFRKFKGHFSTIGQAAFRNSTITGDTFEIFCQDVGQEAFRYLSLRCKKAHIYISGTIGSQAFITTGWGSSPYTAEEDFVIEGPVTAINGGSNFWGSGFALRKSGLKTIFNFREATFTSIPGSCFGADSSYWAWANTEFYLPATLRSISQYGFRYTGDSDIFLLGTTPPSRDANIGTNTYTRFWVPYNSVPAYKSATNWVTDASRINGWADKNTFSTGDTLPAYDSEGYAITWYSDKGMTTQVTTVSDATQVLYCSVAAAPSFYKYRLATLKNCTVQVTDGTTIYQVGDFIPVGATVTITATESVANYVPYSIKVNGTSISSGDSITVNSALVIAACYWDGVTPLYDGTLDNNTWAAIKEACELKIATDFWAVGDLKTDSDNGYQYRIVDAKAGRYSKANGDTSTITFLKEKVQSSQTWAASSNAGYESSRVHQSLQSGGAAFNIESVELRTLVESSRCFVRAAGASSGSYDIVNVGFFLPARYEIFASAGGTGTISETANNGVNYGAYEYFASATAAMRTKTDINSTSSRYWWTRSRYNTSGSINVATSSGSASYVSYSNSYYTPIAFAW